MAHCLCDLCRRYVSKSFTALQVLFCAFLLLVRCPDTPAYSAGLLGAIFVNAETKETKSLGTVIGIDLGTTVSSFPSALSQA